MKLTKRLLRQYYEEVVTPREAREPLLLDEFIARLSTERTSTGADDVRPPVTSANQPTNRKRMIYSDPPKLFTAFGPLTEPSEKTQEADKKRGERFPTGMPDGERDEAERRKE